MWNLNRLRFGLMWIEVFKWLNGVEGSLGQWSWPGQPCFGYLMHEIFWLQARRYMRIGERFTSVALHMWCREETILMETSWSCLNMEVEGKEVLWSSLRVWREGLGGLHHPKPRTYQTLLMIWVMLSNIVLDVCDLNIKPMDLTYYSLWFRSMLAFYCQFVQSFMLIKACFWSFWFLQQRKVSLNFFSFGCVIT